LEAKRFMNEYHPSVEWVGYNQIDEAWVDDISFRKAELKILNYKGKLK